MVMGEDDQTEIVEQSDDVVEETPEEPAEEQAAPQTYRIGEKTFTSQDEALGYARELEAERAVLDAYQQGLRDSNSQGAPGGQNVTPQIPAAPELNTEELFTNPQAFLEKYGQKIKSDTRADFDARIAQQAADEQIWREFTDRHPMLADFRGDVEEYVAKNQAEVVAVIRTKGRPAGLDYVATKIKSDFERKASALKPKRELPNVGTQAPSAARAAGVTSKGPSEKVLSFTEQIRSIRKRR
jgi:hypothetical protein